MKYKVLFTAFLIRTLPIRSGYRPDWISDNKPQYNGAQLLFEGKESIAPGEQYHCILQPLVPYLWKIVSINDILKCMEGSRQVGEAIILDAIL